MWEIVCSDIVTETGEVVKTYGIRNDYRIVYDLSVSREKIEDFVGRLNRYGASDIHAEDLIQDFLGE